MKVDFAKITWPLLVVIGAVCVLVMAALTIQSFIRLFSKPPGNSNEAATSVAVKNAPPAQEVKSISDAGEHPFVHPVSGPVSTPAVSHSQPAPSQERIDFKKMREREKERRATIENMRQTIRAGNLDSNAVMQQEKKLKEIENSGADFL